MSEAPSAPAAPVVRLLGQVDYAQTLQAMREFTDRRGADDADEIWIVEHPPVFTQGQAGRAEHLLATGDIPVIASDRGGQVTYHGPGQIVAYVLVDLRRRGYGVRELVTRIENAMIDTLDACAIDAYADPDAPGVYVDIDGRRHKIGSLGLRVRRGCSYHGLSLNVDMDLAPFLRIDPCGYQGLAMTQVVDLGGPPMALVRQSLIAHLTSRLTASKADPEAEFLHAGNA